MAVPAKRARVSDGSPVAAPCPPPRAAPASRPLPAGPGGEPEGDAVADFLRWCTRVGLELSPKVTVSRQGTVARYGMVARESVQPGELLFAVPRSALLSPHTCSISGLLERERGALQSLSGWVPLLLALLHELQAPASPWSPYFALWPELGRLEHPMFWPEEERLRLLKGTGVPEAVEKDLVNIRSEYYSIVLPFMEAHSDLFSPTVRSLELYRQLVAIVMAYSFQEPLEDDDDEKEPNSPLMVPAADILNHIANHNANLEYSAVLCMPAEEFRDYKERAGWGEEETEVHSLAVTNIPKLRESWKRLLRDSVLLTLETYATDLKTEQDLLSNKEAYAKLSWREQQALQVRYGQKMILHRLLELTS